MYLGQMLGTSVCSCSDSSDALCSWRRGKGGERMQASRKLTATKRRLQLAREATEEH
jgi:hypothetical protein